LGFDMVWGIGQSLRAGIMGHGFGVSKLLLFCFFVSTWFAYERGTGGCEMDVKNFGHLRWKNNLHGDFVFFGIGTGIRDGLSLVSSG